MLDREMSGCKVWVGDCANGNGLRDILIDMANSTWRAGAIVASAMVVVKNGEIRVLDLVRWRCWRPPGIKRGDEGGCGSKC